MDLARSSTPVDGTSVRPRKAALWAAAALGGLLASSAGISRAEVRVWDVHPDPAAVEPAAASDADFDALDADADTGAAAGEADYGLSSFQPPRTAPPRPPAARPAPPRPAPPRRPQPAEDEFAFGGESRYLGSARAPGSSAPNMIGDFFGGGGQIFSTGNVSTGSITVPLAEIPSAGGTRRFKIADGNTPIPTDRVYFLYNHFHNALAPTAGRATALDADRYTPAFEKTFFDGMASLDVRLPIGYTQSSEVDVFANANSKDVEFGNINLTLKLLLWTTPNTAIGGGLGLNLPTADDVDVFLGNGADYHIANDAVHVMPYLGFFSQVSENLFCEGFFQLDLDAGGNPISSPQLGSLGVLNEQNLFYLDVSAGYWLYRNDAATISGIAPTLEVHYATSLQDADLVTAPQNFIGFGNLTNRFDVIDLTAGVTLRIGQQSTLAVAGAFPLKTRGDERFFDAEVLVQFNRYF